MHRDRVAALYDVHSWAGVMFSVLVMIVCASGAIAVFGEEIDHWSNPALRVASDAPARIDADQALQRLSAAAPIDAGGSASMSLPHRLQGYYSMPFPTRHEGLDRLYLDATSGELLPPRQSYLFWYLRHLHVRLLSDWNGRLFVGLVGIAMLLSVVTGLLIHKHLFRDLLRMRWKFGDGGRTLMSELHKWVGAWGLLFHLMIALTGTWLALEGYVSAAIRAAIDAGPETPHVAVDDRPATMTSLAPLLLRAPSAIPGLQPTYVDLDRWGMADATVTIAGDLPGTLVQHGMARVRYDAVSGALLEVRDARTRGFWAQLRAALEPLHYGYYGGLGLKLVYLLLGMMPALLSLTGALIWFDRRARLRGGRGSGDGRTAGPPS